MRDWFQTSLGQWLLQQEQAQCQQLLPSGYYPRSLQVGCPDADFLTNVACDTRYFVDPTASTPPQSALHHAIAQPWALPFSHKTHDLIVLPHSLDFCAAPHAVLREVSEILIPRGCVVIIGFNPWSIWGGLRLPLQLTAQRPWNGHYRRAGRIQDWLALLGFELVGAAMLGYLPPVQRENWREKMLWLEVAGARWWPVLGAVYILVGRKQEIIPRGQSKPIPWKRILPRVSPATARASKT